MTCEEEFFTRINDNCLSKVIFGDDSASKHKGTMEILSLNGKKKVIDDNLSTLTLKKNLLSIG